MTQKERIKQMILLFRLYQQKIYLVLIFVFLFGWAMTSTLHSIRNQKEYILIRVDNFGTTIVNDKSQRIPVEAENFLNHFVGLFYSYTSQNYENHIDRAILLMSEEEALKFVPKLNSMFEKIKITPVLQSSFITKITKIRDLFYEIELEVNRSEKSRETIDKYLIKIELDQIERTKDNPFGLEVEKIEEIYN